MVTILKAYFQETLRQSGGVVSPVIEIKKIVDYVVAPGMRLQRDLIDDVVYSVDLTETGYLATIKNIIYGEEMGKESNGKKLDRMLNNGWVIQK